ncbi:MAG TPA: transposase [Anaerolineales bacterium]|nr:transposase [Anaerolineales bacterium]
MNTTTCISTWTTLVQQFFPAFTAPGAQIFLALVTGWVLCTARRTITGIVPFADPKGRHAHDAFHRFLPDARWDMNTLWKLLTVLLVQTFASGGIIELDLDDTLFHRWGRKICGASWWRDAVRSTRKHIVYAWGLNLVVLTLRVYPPWGGEPLGLPILMRLHRKGGDSLIELAQAMLQQLAGWLPQRSFRLHADGFYATLAGSLGRQDPVRIHLISRMRRDAEIYEPLPKTRRKKGQRGRPPTKGPRLPTPEQMARRVRVWRLVTTTERGKVRKRLVHARQVLWYRVSKTPVLLVISRDPEGKERDDFFFTTDVSLTAEQVIGGFAGRWSIEDTFRNTKQFVGGQEPQTWKGQGPERAAMLSLWLGSVVWLWFLQQPRRIHRVTGPAWYPGKTHPSFQDALAALRRHLWTQRIKAMFGKSLGHTQNLAVLIEALSRAA